MCSHDASENCCRIARRDLLCAAGALAAGATLGASRSLFAAPATRPAGRAKGPAVIRGAFLYPPTESLRKAGYYSWPGSGFDAEGHHRQYATRLTAMADKLGIRLVMSEAPLNAADTVTRFIDQVKAERPDGLLLIPFKKSDWASVIRIIEETKVPTVAMVTAGILLMGHINQLRGKPGIHVIASLDSFEAIEYGLNMIRTARFMKDARLLSIAGNEPSERTVDLLGTQVRGIPIGRFLEAYKSTPPGEAGVRSVAEGYWSSAKERREPTETDVLESARALATCRRLLEEEQADALMMACLEGIARREMPPPCLPFMTLRDEGIAAGCQNDLESTLTMTLVQQLFGKPGFQHNASCDTARNLYFASHCTCPTKLAGVDGPAAPYILRNHAEAGVGAVPQVLWPEGQEVTLAHYLAGKQPRMQIHSGRVVGVYDTPPAGGCRTNAVIAVDGYHGCDVSVASSGHKTLFHGNHAGQLRAFCQMYGIGTEV